MDLQLVETCLDFSRRRKKWLLLLAAAGVSSYGLYKVYNIPSVVQKRKRLLKLIETLVYFAEAVSDAAEVIGVVSKDLKEFLRSDSGEIPTSLKQISKIAMSEEFSGSLAGVTEAVTIGIMRGYGSETKSSENSQNTSSLSDQVLDKLFSTAGTGFASVVVGSFARSLVLSFYLDNGSGGGSNSDDLMSSLQSESPSVPYWVNLICDGKCRGVIADCIQLFVSTAVAVYLDKTMDINTYDEIFAGLTNTKHEKKLKDILVSVCNGAVETLVKTSHQVMTNANSSLPAQASSGLNSPECSSLERIDHFAQEELLGKCQQRSSLDKNKDGGWVDKVSSTLAIPSNRRFLLDVTGRITFETVRSFLDFMLWKLLDGLKTGVDFVNREMIERALEVLRYIGAKSVLAVTVSFALCLHVVGGTRVLMPA